MVCVSFTVHDTGPFGMSASGIQSAGENATTEFKSSFNAPVIETLVAFANAKGGRVLVGVDDTGVPVRGFGVGKETVANWVNEIKTKTQPALIPDVEVLEVGDSAVVQLTITEFPVKPVAYRGKYFRRVGNSNHQMSLNEIANLHLKTMNMSWDFYVDTSHGVDDLAIEKVNRFINEANRIRSEPVSDDPLTVLRKYELLRDGGVTFGCFLLFCREPSLISTIDAGRFDSETIIRDNLTIKDDLFSEVDTCMDFIRKHISKRFVITGKPQRDEVWEYPLEAVREIVINMIVHRDYRASADSTIKIHSDRIEFFNPGGLLDGITMDEILSGTAASHPRNKLIASIFKEAGVIEKYGSGIKRVQRIMAEAGAPSPRFEIVANCFKVTLFPIGGQKSGQKSGQKGCSGSRDRIIALITDNPTITRAQLSEKVGIAQSAVGKHLDALKKDRRIVRMGGRKTGHWKVTGVEARSQEKIEP